MIMIITKYEIKYEIDKQIKYTQLNSIKIELIIFIINNKIYN